MNGEPIIGANILVKGSTIGVISDIDGKFLLNEVPAGSILEISYIGYDNRKSSSKMRPINGYTDGKFNSSGGIGGNWLRECS